MRFAVEVGYNSINLVAVYIAEALLSHETYCKLAVPVGLDGTAGEKFLFAIVGTPPETRIRRAVDGKVHIGIAHRNARIALCTSLDAYRVAKRNLIGDVVHFHLESRTLVFLDANALRPRRIVSATCLDVEIAGKDIFGNLKFAVCASVLVGLEHYLSYFLVVYIRESHTDAVVGYNVEIVVHSAVFDKLEVNALSGTVNCPIGENLD